MDSDPEKSVLDLLRFGGGQRVGELELGGEGDVARVFGVGASEPFERYCQDWRRKVQVEFAQALGGF
jgi:hypothetical protein